MYVCIYVCMYVCMHACTQSLRRIFSRAHNLLTLTHSQSLSLSQRVRGLPRCKAISAGHGHSLALTRTGAVYAFGRGGRGQLGTDDGEDYMWPVCVCDDPVAVAISGIRCEWGFC